MSRLCPLLVRVLAWPVLQLASHYLAMALVPRPGPFPLITSAHPAVDVLMLTSFKEEEAVMSSILAGASGYLFNNVGRSDLLKAIRPVSQGQNLLDPSATKKVLDRLARLSNKERSWAKEAICHREKDVLALVAQGLTDKDVAARLVISENTASNHVSRILDNLGLSMRAEVASFATRHGLLNDDGSP